MKPESSVRGSNNNNDRLEIDLTVHNNFTPQLQTLLTKQKGIKISVAFSNARLRVLIDPSDTASTFISRDAYDRYLAGRELSNAPRFPVLDGYVPQEKVLNTALYGASFRAVTDDSDNDSSEKGAADLTAKVVDRGKQAESNENSMLEIKNYDPDAAIRSISGLFGQGAGGNPADSTMTTTPTTSTATVVETKKSSSNLQSCAELLKSSISDGEWTPIVKMPKQREKEGQQQQQRQEKQPLTEQPDLANQTTHTTSKSNLLSNLPIKLGPSYSKVARQSINTSGIPGATTITPTSTEAGGEAESYKLVARKPKVASLDSLMSNDRDKEQSDRPGSGAKSYGSVASAAQSKSERRPLQSFSWAAVAAGTAENRQIVADTSASSVTPVGEENSPDKVMSDPLPQGHVADPKSEVDRSTATYEKWQDSWRQVSWEDDAGDDFIPMLPEFEVSAETSSILNKDDVSVEDDAAADAEQVQEEVIIEKEEKADDAVTLTEEGSEKGTITVSLGKVSPEGSADDEAKSTPEEDKSMPEEDKTKPGHELKSIPSPIDLEEPIKMATAADSALGVSAEAIVDELLLESSKLHSEQTMTRSEAEAAETDLVTDTIKKLARGLPLPPAGDMSLILQQEDDEGRLTGRNETNWKQLSSVFRPVHMKISWGREVAIPLFFNNTYTTVNAYVVEELIPGKGNAGFDLILGREFLRVNPTLWQHYEEDSGWTCPTTESDLTAATFLENDLVKYPQFKYYDEEAYKGRRWTEARTLYCFIHGYKSKRDKEIKTGESPIFGPNKTESTQNVTRPDIMAGFAVFFSRGSVYNSFGCSGYEFEDADTTLALMQALVQVMSAAKLPQRLVIYTRSTMLCQRFSKLPELVRSRFYVKGEKIPGQSMWETIHGSVNTLRQLGVVSVDLACMRGKKPPIAVKNGLQAAERLARTAAQKMVCYPLEAEAIPSGFDFSKSATACRLEDFERMIKSKTEEETDGEGADRRERAPPTYTIEEVEDAKTGAKKVIVSGDVDPVLDAYRRLTGDWEFDEAVIERMGGLCMQNSLSSSYMTCTTGKTLEQVYREM
ncbi:hypothetical protein BZA70DRAFT_287400 [Myxozyma melibiosi]|uniref:Piwi domain-containing protein n=1 Tax=Myxozyma melibiosi TaxID=54550 RepID=A0ABR1FEA5_9ASCO